MAPHQSFSPVSGPSIMASTPRRAHKAEVDRLIQQLEYAHVDQAATQSSSVFNMAESPPPSQHNMPKESNMPSNGSADPEDNMVHSQDRSGDANMESPQTSTLKPSEPLNNGKAWCMTRSEFLSSDARSL